MICEVHDEVGSVLNEMEVTCWLSAFSALDEDV